jgi:uncharacterized protein YkwD
MLDAVNAARAEARVCNVKNSDGSYSPKKFPATHPLGYDCKLLGAAYQHANYMAGTQFYGHITPDGRDPNDRAHLAGFSGNATENIAAGPTSTAAAVEAWLTSPHGHCANLMDPDASSFAAAWGTTTQGEYHNYWVQMFGYF